MALMLMILFATSVTLQEFSRAVTISAIMIRAPVVEKGKGVMMGLDSQNLFTNDVFVFLNVSGCRFLGRGGVLFAA